MLLSMAGMEFSKLFKMLPKLRSLPVTMACCIMTFSCSDIVGHGYLIDCIVASEKIPEIKEAVKEEAVKEEAPAEKPKSSSKPFDIGILIDSIKLDK